MNYKLSREDNLKIPLFFKLICFFLFSVSLYINSFHWGIKNLLQFSHFTLILLLLGILFNSKLIISMATLASLPFYISWTVFYLLEILFNLGTLSMAYMFLDTIPLFVRSFSLFHIFLIPILLYFHHSFGYVKKSFKYQSLLGVFILWLTYFISPEKNINWVYGIVTPQNYFHPLIYLMLISIGLIFLVYLPTHLILKYFFIED
ncbi:MAG: hypothetical protein ACOCRX_02270 [Candidatus Woesearchaeota archaeon]